jgi:hypothetical protein
LFPSIIATLVGICDIANIPDTRMAATKNVLVVRISSSYNKYRVHTN